MAGMAVATALGAIPWDKVIQYGPQIADAARALWNAVSSDKSQETDQKDSIAERLDQLTAETKELHAQMLAASEIIARVASQNAQLTKRVALLTYACAGSIALALGAIALSFVF